MTDIIEGVRVRFARSARRHRVAKGRALAVMASADPVVTTNEHGELEFSRIGADERGLEIEIVGVLVIEETDGRELLLVIHVMPTQYRKGR